MLRGVYSAMVTPFNKMRISTKRLMRRLLTGLSAKALPESLLSRAQVNPGR